MKSYVITTLVAFGEADPSKNRTWIIESSETENIDSITAYLDEHLSPAFRRAKRVLVWIVGAEYREKYLRPGQEPVRRGEIFADGWALSKRLGKNSNVVAQAIYTAKRVSDDPSRNFFGKVCGLTVCYVSDLDARDGAGAAERFNQHCEEKRIEDPDWG